MPEIKMDYDMMQETISEFLQAANAMDDTKHDINQIAQLIEDGALVGATGDEFSDMLRGPMIRKLTELTEKFEEIARDLQMAVDSMQSNNSSARGEFK
ncbi:MAG: hypothetical protein Phog2KO_47930 [Phototrophicaceae bacterium]